MLQDVCFNQGVHTDAEWGEWGWGCFVFVDTGVWCVAKVPIQTGCVCVGGGGVGWGEGAALLYVCLTMECCA